MLSAMMIAAISPAVTVSHFGATMSPILLLDAVNITSGTIAKGSCRPRMTWLRISSLPVSLAP